MAQFPNGATAKKGFPNLTNPESLPPEVRSELEYLVAITQGYLQSDHAPDGTHGRVRAISVTTAEGTQEFGRRQTMAVAEVVPWSPTDYTADAAIWTVASASLDNLRCSVLGNMMFFQGKIDNTNVSAGTMFLRVKIPFNMAALGQGFGQLYYQDAGGALAVGYAFVSKLDTFVSFSKLAGNWTATAANDTTVRFSIMFTVQPNPL